MFNKSENPLCPLLNKPCIENKCKFWVHIIGKHPQSKQEFDEFDCTVAWLPLLLIENSQYSRQTAAAVNDLKNETVQRQDLFNHTITMAINDKRKFLEEK